MKREFERWVFPGFLIGAIAVTLALFVLLPTDYLFFNRLGRVFGWTAFAGLYIAMLARSVGATLWYVSSDDQGQPAATHLASRIAASALHVALAAAGLHMIIMLTKQIGIDNLGGLPLSFQVSIALAFIAFLLLIQTVLFRAIIEKRRSRGRPAPLLSMFGIVIGGLIVIHFWAIGQSINFQFVRSALTLLLIILVAAFGIEASAWLARRSKSASVYRQVIALLIAALIFALVAGSVNMIRTYSAGTDTGSGSSGGHH